jgi:hypothetical protein
VVGTLTATYGEQSGQDMGPSGAGLVLPSDLPRERERERERETVVSALTQQTPARPDDKTAQAGHLIVETDGGRSA